MMIIKCPLCGKKCSAYSLDYHVTKEHDPTLGWHSHKCTWCHKPLGGTPKSFEEHMPSCNALAAWLLSGVKCHD